MMNIENARKALQKLIELYNRYKEDKAFIGNEKQACQSLIVPLIRDVLHWDTEDPAEFKTEVQQTGKRIDYVVSNQSISQFIVEAKAPSNSIFDDEKYYRQTLAYGYGKQKDFAILTNFKQIVILACQVQWRNPREAELARFDLLTATDEELKLLLAFEKEYWVKSGRENLLYLKVAKHKLAIPVDERLLDDMKHWREQLLRNIKENSKHNKFDFEDEQEFMHVEEEVQKFINRLIFICFCEDKELHEPYLKQYLHESRALKAGWLLSKIRDLFTDYRRIYDSDLFDKSDCDDFKIDDDKLLDIIEELREPKEKAAYDFKSIEADILGKTYENFIGHVQTGKKRFTEKEDIGKRKKGGIYYTPKYIVDYIVNNTVREEIKGKSFEEIKKVRILDPACGSGSFLRVAFDVLLEEAKRALKRDLSYEEKKELLENCIYGVDIDERAVGIAKFNLSLKLAERDKKLPMLRDNIHIGNSLIDDKEIAGFKAFKWEEEFKEIFDDGGFDVVIGNPPYIRIQTLSGKDVDYFNNAYKSATKNYDIYALFVEKGLSLLREGGILGFILPLKFFNADYGLGLRKVITENKSLYKIVDFKDFQVFDSVTTYTCLLFLKKSKNKNVEYIELTNANKLQQTRALTSDILSVAKQEHPNEQAWSFFSETTKSIMSKLLKTKLKLTNISTNIFQGIITGADKIYILVNNGNDSFYSQATEKEYRLENSIIYPLLKGSKHIRKYHVEQSNKYVIFPYEIMDNRATPISEKKLQKDFPKIYNYLLENKSVLQARDKGKMKGPKWYLFSRNQNLNRFGQEKLMTPSIAKRPSFTYDSKSTFFFVGSGGGGGGAYGITMKDKKLYLAILGILNSKVVAFFIQQTSSKFSGGYFAFNKQYIENIPIIIPDDGIRQKLEALVRVNLNLNEQLNKLGNKNTSETARLKAEIEKTDQEIDELVYKIYGITEEEEKIVEESLK
ncbi:MAG: N-6 DNA methylase [Nanoarchaeota archaeon]|nr:N-6 DNA methylase [Nanoarchaeota archaeon]